MKEISDLSSSGSPLVDSSTPSGPEWVAERSRKIGAQRADARIGSLRSLGVLFAAFLVMVGTGVIINVLSRRADEDRRFQRLLVQLEANARELEALEWKTIFKGHLDRELSAQQEKIRSAMDAGIGKLRPLELSLARPHRIAEKYEAYCKLTDEEFRLLGEGKIREAQEIDAAKVDPSFEELHKALSETGNAFDKQASRTLALVRAGTFLVLLAAVGFIATLFWHYHQRRRAGEVFAAEQQVLNLLRAITEGTSDAIFAKDREGRYLMINTAGARLVGKTPEEMVGLDDAQLFSEETRTRIIERDRVVMRTGETRTDEDITTTLAGRSRVYLTTKGALHDSTGAIMGLFGVSRDITERKQAEEALAAQVLRYKTLMETSKDSIYVVDEKGDLQEANAAFLRRRGYTAAEVKGLNIADWDARWTREQLQKRLRELAGSGAVFETRHRTKEGSIFDVEVCATSVRIGGKALFFAVTRDITERKKADQALRESEARFRSYFDLGLIGVAITSPAKGYLEVNDELCRILGYERSELLRKTWRELTHPADLAADVAHFNRVLAGEIDGYSRGKRFIRKDGEVIDTTISVKCLRRADGSVDYFVGLLQDITERKRAEERLQEYEKMVEGLEEMIVVVDRHYRYLLVNQAYLKSHGLERERLLGRLAADVVDAEVFENVIKKRLDECLQGKAVQYELKYCYPDRGERDLLVSYFPIEGPAGIDRAACVLRDITERKKAEAALRDSETRFRQIAENIDEMFWITDLEGSSTIYMSPAYERITGRSCESLYAAPKSWRNNIHPEDRPRMEATFASDPGSTGDYTYRIVRPDGSIRWIRDRGFPVRDESGEVVRFAGIAEDITANKCAEEELQQVNEQLRVLSRRLFQVRDDERRHLARELHDEIGQALTAVKINLDSIEAVEGSAQSLCLKESSTILDNLLWQVRQISLDLHSSLIDDLGLAPALRSLLDQQARRAGLRTQFCAAEPLQNLDPGIQTTGFRIAQEAITNVLRHAKAQSLSVHLHTEGGKLRMKIVDDGMGFSLAEIERRARQEGGFGLMGMRERAALVGGRVQIISSTNKGTRVEVSLPLNAADAAP
jgi:PAS domain S-box-containing protein